MAAADSRSFVRSFVSTELTHGRPSPLRLQNACLPDTNVPVNPRLNNIRLFGRQIRRQTDEMTEMRKFQAVASAAEAEKWLTNCVAVKFNLSMRIEERKRITASQSVHSRGMLRKRPPHQSKRTKPSRWACFSCFHGRSPFPSTGNYWPAAAAASPAGQK